MDFDQYTTEKQKLREKYNKNLSALMEEYARSNSQVKIGDMVTDHIGTIKVTSIKTFVTDPPSCIYCGPCYTKGGKPFKSGKETEVYQFNILEEK